MNKKILISTTGCVFLLVCLAASCLQNNQTIGNADTKSYKISMNNEKNKFDSDNQSSIIKTNLDNDITFKHNGILTSDTSWHVLNTEGYFYNVTPIHGLTNIIVKTNSEAASYRIYYSSYLDTDEEFVTYEEFSQTTTFDFNEQFPNYFKIVNVGSTNLDILSIDLEYLCANQYVSLNVLSADESAGSVSGDSGLRLPNTSVTVSAIPNTGYKFTGWYDGSSLISSENPYTFTMPDSDLSLVAQFDYLTYELVVESESSDEGSVIDVSGTYTYLSEITVSATCENNFYFAGWHDGTNLISNNNPYTFKMPAKDLSLTAIFWNQDEKAQWDDNHGVNPELSDDNKTITYGLYPQTALDDNSEHLPNDVELIQSLNALDESSINEENGWYFFNGEYYTKAVATPYEDGYYFSNNELIVSGKTYWFKCEPITWRVLSNTGNEYFLLSNTLIDTQTYYDGNSRKIDGKSVDYNNYQYSEMRAWLNGYDGSSYSVDDYTNKGFYNAAFALDSSAIKTTIISDTIQDNVSILTFDDLDKTEYGFNGNGDRSCTSSDYSRNIGCRTSFVDDTYGYGSYWTRSPGNYSSTLTYIYPNGSSYTRNGTTSIKYFGVRPSITIVIE